MASPESEIGPIQLTFNALRKVREHQGKYTLKDVEIEHKASKEGVYAAVDVRLKDSKRLEQALRKTVEALEMGQVSITPLTVTATTCLFIAMDLMRWSASRFRTRGFTGITSFDMGRGFATQMAGLLGEDKIFQDSKHISDQEELLRLKSINELFTDPTGFSYVDNMTMTCNITRPRRGGMIEPYEVQESVTEGMKFGAANYKRIYPIAEKVLSGR